MCLLSMWNVCVGGLCVCRPCGYVRGFPAPSVYRDVCVRVELVEV